MTIRDRSSKAYAEYQKKYHRKWIEEPGKREKWNTYQRARTLKQTMIRDISSFFRGKIESHIRFEETLNAFRITCLFRKLTTVSKPVFRRKMEEKGYTVDFDTEITVSVIFKILAQSDYKRVRFDRRS